ncbi:MAG: Arc family DNA-binding protein [Comamonas sp.]|nr:Arc family DNA-binding protein [Comamonas sp.]
MSRTDQQFKLRMPPALRAQVEQAAEQANRSLNAEIVTRLQASFTQAKPKVSANDQHEPVSAVTPQGVRLSGLLRPQSPRQVHGVRATPAPRELRLLCVLRQSKLGDAPNIVSIDYLPIHTMHRLPPRAMVRGKWSDPRYAGLYLRETQAVEPTAEVLERCLQQRQPYALRAPARTVRTGGVSA